MKVKEVLEIHPGFHIMDENNIISKLFSGNLIFTRRC